MDDFDHIMTRVLLLPAYFLILLIPAIISKPIALIPIGIGGFLIYLVIKFMK